MKLHNHFKVFLDEEVNLNATRIEQLENSIEAVTSAIKNSNWGPQIIGFASQGSWAHHTIIKPLPDKEYDADLIVFVKHKDGWLAKDYVNKLATTLDGIGTYTNKIRGYSHCATIEYAGDKRIDIVPCVVDRLFSGKFEVCNRLSGDSGEFEVSAPIEYTNWIIEKNNVAGGNTLKKVTRLLKYLRDIKGNFTCPSFLFTTLLGSQIYDGDKDSADFADLPSALKTIVGRLDNWLQARPTLPNVANPVFPSENQSGSWDQTKYSNFRDKINLYRGWIDEALNEGDRDESIGKWQRVFGDSFAAGEAKEASRISESENTNRSVLPISGHFRDLVEKVKSIGASALPARITKLPYMQRPTWRPASSQVTVKINASLYTSKDGQRIRQISSLEPLKPGGWLKFSALNTVGAPFPIEFKVKWRVTNTDKAAYDAKQLRGGFYNSDSGTSRMESLSFRGIHFVEAFLIRKSDDRLVGQSQPFFVLIE